jgi:hypothetical protein
VTARPSTLLQRRGRGGAVRNTLLHYHRRGEGRKDENTLDLDLINAIFS